MLTLRLFRFKLLKVIRWSAFVISIATLLWLGINDVYFKYKTALVLADFYNLFNHQETNSNSYTILVTHSNQIVNLIYRLVYAGICLIIIHSLFWNSQVAKISVFLYVLVLACTFFLYTLAEVIHVEALRVAAFRIDTMIASPMPIVLLIPALYLTKHKQPE
ncbi:XrtX-associated membrane protein [Pontibacter sp. H249]|uniref:XrtX-associated membrane protein n=1 Tax=Pontibacter sp. H249 TaxID=3133420 RepID=UPI0040409F43